MKCNKLHHCAATAGSINTESSSSLQLSQLKRVEIYLHNSSWDSAVAKGNCLVFLDTSWYSWSFCRRSRAKRLPRGQETTGQRLLVSGSISNILWLFVVSYLLSVGASNPSQCIILNVCPSQSLNELIILQVLDRRQVCVVGLTVFLQRRRTDRCDLYIYWYRREDVTRTSLWSPAKMS